MDTQVNWKQFVGGTAVVDIGGGAAHGGLTYWGEIRDIGQDGTTIHIFYDGRAAVMKGASHKWGLSEQLDHQIQSIEAQIHDLDEGGVAIDASRICNTMLFVFPKGYKPKDGDTFQWSLVEGTSEWQKEHRGDEMSGSIGMGTSNGSYVVEH